MPRLVHHQSICKIAERVAGIAAANIAAQRAFFNFLLTVGIKRAPQGAVTVPTITAGRPATLTATITGGDGNYTYQWVSTASCLRRNRLSALDLSH